MRDSLIALICQMDRLAAMPSRERLAYAWRVGARTAMAIRKRMGIEEGVGTAEEALAWERGHLDTRSYSTILRASEGAERATRHTTYAIAMLVIIGCVVLIGVDRARERAAREKSANPGPPLISMPRPPRLTRAGGTPTWPGARSPPIPPRLRQTRYSPTSAHRTTDGSMATGDFGESGSLLRRWRQSRSEIEMSALDTNLTKTQGNQDNDPDKRHRMVEHIVQRRREDFLNVCRRSVECLERFITQARRRFDGADEFYAERGIALPGEMFLAG